MPITLNCPCGKTLRVADEHAGKRVKCPVCNAVIAPPAPEPSFEVVEESPLPRGRGSQAKIARCETRMTTTAATTWKTPPRIRPRRRESRTSASAPVRTTRTTTRGHRACRKSGLRKGEPPPANGLADIGGGIAMLIGGVAVALIGNGLNGRGATRLMILGIVLSIAGLVTLVQGLTGNISEDE